MLRIIPANDRRQWNKTVKSFENWDIYYLNEYACSYKHHGDGEPILIEYYDSDSHFCYVVLLSDIAKCPLFYGIIDQNVYYDCETPYGYGGPLSIGDVPEESQSNFLCEIGEYAKSHSIISQFVRFHPLLGNHVIAPKVFETKYLHDTIFIDTSSTETIVSNMDSKNRNMVRKALHNGVSIERRAITDYREFRSIYIETMDRDHADEYYYFEDEYFDSLACLNDNAVIFFAVMNDIPISASIMYYNDRYMHYHLAGTRAEYRSVAPNNLLLYEAACWACGMGIKRFHLGGGISDADTLFGFKKQFNKNGRCPFYIGRTIFDRNAYDELLHIRKKEDPLFNSNNDHMIQYRA